MIEDRLDGPECWTIQREVHALMVHEAGSYHWLETWLDGRRTSMGDPLPGEIWFAPAGREYRGAAKGGAVRYVMVEIPQDRLPTNVHGNALAGHQDGAMAALSRALVIGDTDVDADADAENALLTLLFETLDSRCALRPQAPDVARRMDALISFIQTHIETHLSVDDMAAEAGMSVNSLIVHFARATGRTPAQYLLRQRLRRASWYLMNRPISVAEIAFATGFSSHAHLCSAFRAKLGMSPGEWREKSFRRAQFE